MSTTGREVEIRLLTDRESIRVPIQESTTAEDVCIVVAKTLHIGPICRHLFSLRLHDTKIWLCPDSKIIDAKANSIFDYRLRFKVPKLSRLKKTDREAFNYYFHQVRKDVIDGLVPDIKYDKHKGELLGLSVADMYRVKIDQGLALKEIEADYRKYIPKILLKYHFLFLREKIHSSLSKIQIGVERDGWFVKEEYLNLFDKIAPNYLSENYTAQVDENGCVRHISLQVNPFHKEEPGVRYSYEGKDEWHYLCSIEDLCYISVRNDGTLEISRKNGIPSYFRFTSPALMYSFVSLLDGYYRLICKWTFNLCNDVCTPSLQKLHELKCHGPVGGHFSYQKLEDKRSNKPGTFILRESEIKYDVYYLDVCTHQATKPMPYKIEKIRNDEYLFSHDSNLYRSIQSLVNTYRNSNNTLELLECLPPSEYDKSCLLMCAQEDLKWDKTADPEQFLLNKSPQIINLKNISVFKADKKESRSGTTYRYRAMWKTPKSGKIEISMKILKADHKGLLLNDFLELADSWACLQSNAIVKLFGVTLRGQISIITEYLDGGPFDVYLRENTSQIEQVDLVEAGSFLASALWHLEECGIAHGNIRCSKLLVSRHNKSTCLVKLSDPGLHKYRTEEEVHWIPPECYKDYNRTKTTPQADVWAFGTTLWEIFSFGSLPDRSYDKNYYSQGKRLPRPMECPQDIYRLMKECWVADFYERKKPQAIMRDINQVLYQVFNSRRNHSYATVFPRGFKNEDQLSMTGSTISGSSVTTQLTGVGSDVTTGTLINMSNEQPLNLFCRELEEGYSTTHALSAMFLQDQCSDCGSIDSDTFMQIILELDKDTHVTLLEKIGQGFYGEVFKAHLEGTGREPQEVAVKKLRAGALSATRQDLEREIAIMERLKHPNIVEVIKAVDPEPDISLVMEYVEHGSLQIYLKINKETLKTDTLLKFALDVACGMEYLGKQKIVHRDLAARNILVASENHVKISDFGLAQVVGQNNYYVLKTNRELPIKWYAPESLREMKYSHRSDIWSYGVTLYEMFSLGEDPKLPSCTDDMDQAKLLAALDRGERLPCPPNCPQDIYVKLIAPCWKSESRERPAFASICDTIQKLRC